jgi:multiple sugar transport system substrate-binding protein
MSLGLHHIFGVVLCLLAGALLVGCGEEQDDGRMELTFEYWANFMDNDNWKQLIKSFETQNPGVKIQPKWVTGDYAPKLRLEFISDTAADIILMDDEPYPAYAVRGYLEDLKPFIMRQNDELERRIAQDLGWVETPDDYEPYFLPTSLQSYNYKGFVGGLPWDGNSEIMFYNKDMFDAAGMEYPQEDWNWDDLREMAKALTKDLDGDGRVDQFGTNVHFAFMPVEPYIWSWGGEILNEDNTKAVLNSERAIEALEFMMKVWHEDKSSAMQSEMDGMFADVQLLTGRVGVIRAGTYLLGDLKRIRGGDVMRWGLQHVPYGPYGDRYTRVTWDGISINAKISDEKKEIAWKFVKHVLAEESQAVFGKTNRGIPSVAEFARKYYVHPDSGVQEEIIVDSTHYGKLTPITPYYLELRDVAQLHYDDLNLNRSTPREVLNTIAVEVDEILAREVERWD